MPDMTEAEKFACEREARHDVAARGRIVDPAPVQHYLTHARCEDGRHPVAHHERPHPASARRTATSAWLRWGEDGRSGPTPVFPPV